MTKREKLIRHFNLSETDVRIITMAAHGVWEQVAGDCLNSIAEYKGKDPEAVTMSRAEVIEVVLDACRLEDELKRHKLSPECKHFIDVWHEFRYQHPENQLARDLIKILMRETFTYSRYGY